MANSVVLLQPAFLQLVFNNNWEEIIVQYCLIRNGHTNTHCYFSGCNVVSSCACGFSTFSIPHVLFINITVLLDFHSTLNMKVFDINLLKYQNWSFNFQIFIIQCQFSFLYYLFNFSMIFQLEWMQF